VLFGELMPSELAGGLSEAEVSEFARVFPDLPSAVQLLSAAGFPRERVPALNVSSSLQLWDSVSVELARGVLWDGRRRLLTAAAGRYPANPMFGGGGGLRAVWVSSWEWLRASRPLPAMFVARDGVVDRAVGLLRAEGRMLASRARVSGLVGPGSGFVVGGVVA